MTSYLLWGTYFFLIIALKKKTSFIPKQQLQKELENDKTCALSILYISV